MRRSVTHHPVFCQPTPQLVPYRLLLSEELFLHQSTLYHRLSNLSMDVIHECALLGFPVMYLLKPSTTFVFIFLLRRVAQLRLGRFRRIIPHYEKRIQGLNVL